MAHRSVAIRWRRGSIRRWGCSIFCCWGSVPGASVVCRGEEEEEEGEEEEEQASRDQGRDEVDCDVAVGEELPRHVQHLRLHAFVSSKLNQRRCNGRDVRKPVKSLQCNFSYSGTSFEVQTSCSFELAYLRCLICVNIPLHINHFSFSDL